MVIWMLALLLSGESLYKVTVGDPLIYQDEDNPDTFLTGIHQLESNGDHLFILRERYPSVIEIKRDGRFVRNIGRSGEGPGELGHHGPISMAVHGNSVWIFRNDMKSINYFENGEFKVSFKPESYQMARNKLPAYHFGFDQDHVLIQSYPGDKSLAVVYDYTGQAKQRVGKILPIEPDFLKVNPAINNTSWIKDGESWWCLFIYRPLLREYNSNFKLLREITLHGPEIEEKEEIFFKNEVNPNWQYPKWHFSDFKVFKNSIYILCEGALYQVDKLSGEIKSRTIFMSNKTMLAIHNYPRVYFHYLAFTNDGQLFLAHSAIPFDLGGVWKAKLPFDPLKN